MTHLIIADHDGKTLRDTTAKAVVAAQKMGGEIHILVYGAGATTVAKDAAQLSGVSKVLTAESDALNADIAEAVTALIQSIAGAYQSFLFVASASGKNIAPRLAALLDTSILSDVLDIVDANTFVRPIYAGNALETVTSSEAKKVLSVRTTAFKAAPNGGSAAIEAVAAPAVSQKIRFVSEEKVVSARPELGAAKIVVSGGRALGSAEEFKAVLEPLADKLGAAIGASRAAVDAGYAPNDYQVGQTGKVVAPDLYIAIGISGAIQHLAGMKDSKVIVAINKDPEAPIFSVADYGIVDDYKNAVPALLAALS